MKKAFVTDTTFTDTTITDTIYLQVTGPEYDAENNPVFTLQIALPSECMQATDKVVAYPVNEELRQNHIGKLCIVLSEKEGVKYSYIFRYTPEVEIAGKITGFFVVTHLCYQKISND